MEIRERLSQLNPDLHEEDLATIYGNLGVLYDDQGQLEIAEQYYLQSKKIIEQLFRQNPDRFGEDLAATCDILELFMMTKASLIKRKRVICNRRRFTSVSIKQIPRSMKRIWALPIFF